MSGDATGPYVAREIDRPSPSGGEVFLKACHGHNAK